VGGSSQPPRHNASWFFFEEKAKNSCSIGFGLSAEAQPEFIKVFWFFFSKKHRFLCRLPSVEAISIPGQLQKEPKNFCESQIAPSGNATAETIKNFCLCFPIKNCLITF
jgi:hypothetical protein